MNASEPQDSQSSPSWREKDHVLGIRIVHDDLVKEGHKIEGVNTDPGIVPQIVTSRDGKLFFFIVMTDRGPLPTIDPQTRKNCIAQAAKFGASCMFAPVALMATGQRGPDGEEGFFVNYRGYVSA